MNPKKLGSRDRWAVKYLQQALGRGHQFALQQFVSMSEVDRVKARLDGQVFRATQKQEAVNDARE